jgi:hypothetical protein
MIGALEAEGDNTTKLKHMSKAKLIREGNLPTSLTPDEQLIENSRKFLEHHRHVLEKAARIARDKKKAKEDAIDARRFEAAVLKDERMMVAEEQRFQVALRKEERKMDAKAKKAAMLIKKAAAEAKRESAKAKKEAAKAKKETAAEAKKLKKEAAGKRKQISLSKTRRFLRSRKLKPLQ